MNLYPLYIDPGTGSMLFSILIAAAAAVYFMARAVIKQGITPMPIFRKAYQEAKDNV